MRSLYRKDDLTGALPLGIMEARAVAFQNYKLTFTPGSLALYQRNQQNLLTNPASVLRDEGGYLLGDDQKAAGLFPSSDPDGCWWTPSGRNFFSPGAADTPEQELASAVSHFFLPRRFQNPFGDSATALYDANDLLILETRDALQNSYTSGERDSNNNITNRNDYRLTQPALVTDPNGNRAAVAYDTLGLVAGTAVMGKSSENLGDSLTGFQADLQQPHIDQFFHNPRGPIAASLLGNATSRIIYDLDRFQQTSAANPHDPTQWEAVFVATIARETHVGELQANQAGRLQIGFSYSDGFGREIQKKMQTEPGPIAPGGAAVNARWVGSGWTVFNNKGKPVRQYEPFFDDNHDFKFGVSVGVSPILFYDPAQKVVGTLHPNRTWEKVVFDPWRQQSWDANDTVLIADPSLDADVGPFFQRIPSADYLPTWYGQRNGGQRGAQEQDATAKAASHAATPTGAWFDTLGRTFLTVADNAAAGKYATRVELDIEGQQRSVIDALGRKIVTYDYDMVGTKFHQNNADAGERWILNDAMGKPLIGWNSRGFQTRHESDQLRRPTKLFVKLDAGPEQLSEKIVYGEGQPNDQAANLRGKAFRSFDCAGVVTNSAYDFKGNPLNSTRQFLADYKSQLDWSQAQAPEMQTETFASATTYDALNRPVTLLAPDGSVIRPTINEANLLEQLSVNLRGSADAILFVTNIDYNAKGQRELIEYGNGARTTYEYDPETFRLINLKTTRKLDSPALQDLTYFYDPVGNITQIQDAAQQTIYFNNQVVTPSNDYAYDAIYRLIIAQGREHIGQAADPQPGYDWNDSSRVNLPNPNDGNAMRRYAERYQYDAVGNFLKMIHQAVKGSWTRGYSYSPDFSNSPPASNNRLFSTSLPGDPADGPFSAKYTYDAHGNIVQMPHLPVMEWDFKDQLRATQQQVVNNAPGEKTYYVYDAAGQRVRKVTERPNGTKKNERTYLGGLEVYREYDSSGTTTLERQTLHVMDDKQRIALTESLTQGKEGSPAQLIRYQFGNHLGSVSLELDAAAKVISFEEYTPYGSTTYQAVDTSIKAAAKRYRYTGKERDDETELNFHGARYYAPWLGRWTSCDSKGELQLFAYCSNNPIGHHDPDGKEDRPPEMYGEEVTGRETQDQVRQSFAAHNIFYKGSASWVENESGGYWHIHDWQVVARDTGTQLNMRADNITAGSPRPQKSDVKPQPAKVSIAQKREEEYSAAKAGMWNKVVELLEPPGSDMIRARTGYDPSAWAKTSAPAPTGDPQRDRELKENYEAGGMVISTAVAAAPIGLEGMAESASLAADRLPLPTGTGLGSLGGQEWMSLADHRWAAASAANDVTYAEGSFSPLYDGYPTGATTYGPPVPKPPVVRLLSPEEQAVAREAANSANAANRSPAMSGGDVEVHHIQPVKFGGSPNDPANLSLLTRAEHIPFTNWWNSLERWAKGGSY